MTICVYWKGKFATDRQMSVLINDREVGKFSGAKIRLYDEHSPFLFNGHRIRAIVVASNPAELDSVLMAVASKARKFHERVNYDLYEYLKIRAAGGGEYDLTTYILSDRMYRVNWIGNTVHTYPDGEANTRLFISEPIDTALPIETIEWCNSAEEIAWLYCGFSQKCGFGVDVLDCVTGEVTYHPYPSEAVRQSVRRTLLENLDRFFVRPEPDNNVEELVYEF